MSKTNLKYFNTKVVFKEIPNEITLAINISGCKIHCPGCHSKFLWSDIGAPLTKEELKWLICENDGITCVGLMGGDSYPSEIIALAKMVKQLFPSIKVAWYSGKEAINKDVQHNLKYFDYIKIGPYIAEKGPLTNPETNQIMLAKGSNLKKMDANNDMWYDITDKFWRKENESENKEVK